MLAWRGDGPFGSNSWATRASKSASGLTTLGHDPHLALSNPALWYLVHLDAKSAGSGDLHAAGVSFAGLPGVFLGHSETLGWGATVANYDLSDVYIEQLVIEGRGRRSTRDRRDLQWEHRAVRAQNYLDPAPLRGRRGRAPLRAPPRTGPRSRPRAGHRDLGAQCAPARERGPRALLEPRAPGERRRGRDAARDEHRRRLQLHDHRRSRPHRRLPLRRRPRPALGRRAQPRLARTRRERRLRVATRVAAR